MTTALATARADLESPPAPQPERPFLGWRMVALCFLAQNCGMGFSYGSFGPLLASTKEHFGVSFTWAAAGMSLTTFALGVTSPLAGMILRRVPLRSALLFGGLISAIAYWSLAVLTWYPAALLMFALIGAGMSLLAAIGPVTLINRWFLTDRGKVLSLVNLPIFLFFTPFVIGELLPRYGRFAILGGLGTILLVTTALLLLVVERPEDVGQSPRGHSVAVGPGDTVEGPPPLPTAQIFTSWPFWLLSLAIGLMAGTGVSYAVHIVPFGVERHLSFARAAGLMSVYAGAGIFGTLLLGWLADRIGGLCTLALSAFCQAISWWGLLQVDGMALYGLGAVIGASVVPLVMLHGTALSAIFGAPNISRAMGFSYVIKLPFLFGFPPLVARLFMTTGSYRVPFLLTAGLLALSSALFLLAAYVRRRPPTVHTHDRSAELGPA
jgi:MFS family permease